MSDQVFDVYTHALGKGLEESVAAAVKTFQARHSCAPAAVWVNPALLPAGEDVAGLPVVRSMKMNPWYVYLELPEDEPADDLAGGRPGAGEWDYKQPMLLPF